GEDAVPLDGVGRRFAGVVRDEADRRRPRDPARRVPEEELPPLHAAQAGDPRGGEAEDRDEAAEEHRLPAVPVHDALRSGEETIRVAVEPPPAGEERTAAEASD